MSQVRTLSLASALAACLIAAVSSAWAEGQRVTPDPAVLQTLQAIQDAFNRKDPAQYDRLIAADVEAVFYDETGSRQVEKTPRAELIKRLLTAAEETQFLSPFIDATPVSQRILYAENIPGGQRVRVLLLNRAVPEARSSVGWVTDLGVTRQGGQYILTEVVPLPADLAKQVFWPCLTEAKTSGFLSDEAKSVALYNKYWERFAATLPRPAAMPTGPRGTETLVLPPSMKAPVAKQPVVLPPHVVKAPANIVPPPPPRRINFPVQPTSYVPLPNPAPVFLPPNKATARVREWRAQAQQIVERQFAAFVQKFVLELYFNFHGRRLYINVYQNRHRATFLRITFVITIRLIFVQPPRGPMEQYVVPIVETETPEPPVQPEPVRQTPIALPPPAQRATGCMVLTDTAKLKAKHGDARYEQIRQYLASFGEIIDLAGKNASDFRAVDAIVEQSFNRNRCDCLFIFGNHDIVPLANMPNPTQGFSNGGDPDPELFTDDYYADFDHDAHQDPEIMIVRMPDDPGILDDRNSVLYRPASTSPRITLTDYAGYSNRNRSGPPVLDQIANPNQRNLLQRSGPLNSDSFSRTFFQGHNVLINLHGNDGWDTSSVYHGEAQDPGQSKIDFITAMTADHAVAPDGVVFCCACYGGSTFKIQPDGSIVPKTSDNHVGLRFLRNGASAFIGYTRVTWQAVDPDPANLWRQAEPLAARRFIELTREGNSPQKAFQLLKREMAPMSDSAPQNKKMQHQLIYLGLPPVGSRPVAPVATPQQPATLKTQLVRVLEKASDAAQQRKPDVLAQVMTPTIRDGIEKGPEVPAQDKAQQLVQLMDRPEVANPLANKEDLASRVFLVEKTSDKEYTAYVRVPFEQNVLADPKGDKQTLETVQRLQFRQEGDEIKLSGWEPKNEAFAEKVVKPHVEWVKKNNVSDPEEAKDNYESLVEAFMANTVTTAAQAKTDATASANPLAPQGSGTTPSWVLPVAVGGGLLVLIVLITVIAVASGKRRPPYPGQGMPYR